MWCIPKITPEFEKRMFDVLDVYARPYDTNYPVVCIDEKSQQLLGDTRQPLPMAGGIIARHDYEYQRNGTVNLFVAVEPKGNRRYVKVTKHRKKRDFALFVNKLVTKTYRKARKVILVCDNRFNKHYQKVNGIILTDQGYRQKGGVPKNFKICNQGRWNDRMWIERLFSLWTRICGMKHSFHRSVRGFKAKVSYLAALTNLVFKLNGEFGFNKFSMVQWAI